MAISLIRPAIIEFNGNPLSDHNREPVEQEERSFKNDVRTVGATRKRQFIGNKRLFRVSWEFLPARDSDTVDGFWGANSLREFYQNNVDDTFTVTLFDHQDGNGDNYIVLFNSFSATIQKRFEDWYLWEVTLEVEEV